MSIISNATENNKEVNFLGMTADARENILRALVGNLKKATWAYETVVTTRTVGTQTVTYNEFEPISATKQGAANKAFAKGWTVFQDTDDLGMLATNHGIWVKIYPTNGKISVETEVADLNYMFCVYLTLVSEDSDINNGVILEPSDIVYETGEPDEPNFSRFHLADGGNSQFLTICNNETDPAGNGGRNVNVVAAVNAAIQQEIKFNRSTKPWSRKYDKFALFTKPEGGDLIAWGKLTNPIEVAQADVVPLFEEGNFRLFFPAPEEVETYVNAEANDTTV